MTLKELMEQLPTWENKDRLPIKRLYHHLSVISQAEVTQFQHDWYDAHPIGRRPKEEIYAEYLEFCKKQNELIKHCIEMEMTQIGIDTRAACGLEPLTWGTEI